MSNGKPWLPHHTKTLRLLMAVGYRYQQIAMLTGHSVHTVKRRAELLNLDPPARIDCNWMRKKVVKPEVYRKTGRKGYGPANESFGSIPSVLSEEFDE